jgi:hypothetical protein
LPAEALAVEGAALAAGGLAEGEAAAAEPVGAVMPSLSATAVPGSSSAAEGKAWENRRAPLAFTTGTLELLDGTTEYDLALSALEHPLGVVPPELEGVKGEDAPAPTSTGAPGPVPAPAPEPAPAPALPAAGAAAARFGEALRGVGVSERARGWGFFPRPIAISLAVYVVVVLVCLWLKYNGVAWSFVPVVAAAIPPVVLGVRGK